MNHEERVAEAERLQDEEKLSKAEIAERMGVATKTIYRWLVPGYREKDLATSRDWKRRNKDRTKEYDKRNHEEARVPCPSCEKPMEPDASLCQACRSRVREQRAELLERWWAEGILVKEIARRLGWSEGYAGVEIVTLRKAGRNFPYRYKGWAEKR